MRFGSGLILSKKGRNGMEAVPNFLISLIFVLMVIALLYGRDVPVAVGDVGGGVANGTVNGELIGAHKLYWFIPDGMRAEPGLFNIYEWAENGELPNIKRLMDRGTYGYSIPQFPSHTPVNFATLLTGSTPKVHGVADGPMHVEGFPLDRVSVGGFRSVAKNVPSIWSTLEDAGKSVFLLSLPGSTPPELDKGATVRGRWGGWGADYPAVIFQSKEGTDLDSKVGRGRRLFFFGPELTSFSESKAPEGWDLAVKSFSPEREVTFSAWGSTVDGLIVDSTDDNESNYDAVTFSFDKKKVFTTVREGEWSGWLPITLVWKTKTPDGSPEKRPISTQVKINVIKLGDAGFFRVRFYYNVLNPTQAKPSEVADELNKNVGPMVDFVDNFPPQLIFFNEDKQTFLEELNFSFDWHRGAAEYVLDTVRPDVFIQDIYSSNQMLTGRWWLGYVDPKGAQYNQTSEAERDALMGEVKAMYKRIDEIVGVYLDNADNDTLIVLSSDHGAVPLRTWVQVNNILADYGYLKFTIDNETGDPIIDWENSTAIYLKMDNVYVHPDGLAGNWKRGKGLAYEALRNEVRNVLLSVRDGDVQPIIAAIDWEDVEAQLELPPERVGDLVIAVEAGYGLNEEMDDSFSHFSKPLKSGYKQAIFPENETGIWTPFIIAGPGVRKGYQLPAPIKHKDQYPTIMKLLNVTVPDFVEGKALERVFDDGRLRTEGDDTGARRSEDLLVKGVVVTDDPAGLVRIEPKNESFPVPVAEPDK